MSDARKKVVESVDALFVKVDDTLNTWQGEGCLQIPTLMMMLATSMNWSDKQVREYDPLVRFYIRTHEDWHVTRGAHGGIQRKSDFLKKEAAVKAKVEAKNKVRAAVEAKAQQQNTEVNVDAVIENVASVVNDAVSDEELSMKNPNPVGN